MVQMSRRQFLRVTGATIAGSSLAMLGFAPGQAARLAASLPAGGLTLQLAAAAGFVV